MAVKSSESSDKRRKWTIWSLVILIALGVIFVFSLPAMLRALPSRYLLYLPDSLQQLGARGHVAALPAPGYGRI